MEMKEQLEKNQENLEKANKKSLELDNKSKEVKEIINDLKPTLIKKDNYILKQEDKEKIENYINQVDKTNDEYKNIQTLSITLNNVDTQIQENQKEIQTLTENNEALQLRVDTLTKNNKVKDKQIKYLKEENLSLRQSLSFWKDKFLKIISFILCSNSKLAKSTSNEGIPRHCTHRSSRPSDNCNFYSSEYSTFSILITRHATDIIYVLFTALPKNKAS